MDQPQVSWLIPTTLFRHYWWKLLIEFLLDDYPSEKSECIFLGTQDKNFAHQAQQIGAQIYDSLKFHPNVAHKWKQVRFIENYDDSGFNISQSRNLLLEAAQGDIVIYRDCDTELLRPGFTRFAVSELLRSHYGLLSFSSLRNGKSFKPRSSLITRPDPTKADLTLACSIGGMATVGLKSILTSIGGWNNSLPKWGEHIALCAKLARAGFLMGYSTDGFWLTTADGMSSLSLTNYKNPQAAEGRLSALTLLETFYNITQDDAFWRTAMESYGLPGRQPRSSLGAKFKPDLVEFSTAQMLNSNIDRYDFKPWGCLSHSDSQAYIDNAESVARPFFQAFLQ